MAGAPHAALKVRSQGAQPAGGGLTATAAAAGGSRLTGTTVERGGGLTASRAAGGALMAVDEGRVSTRSEAAAPAGPCSLQPAGQSVMSRLHVVLAVNIVQLAAMVPRWLFT